MGNVGVPLHTHTQTVFGKMAVGKMFSKFEETEYTKQKVVKVSSHYQVCF